MMSESSTAKAGQPERSFTRKQIRVTFTIRSSSNPGLVLDQETLSGYRCQIEVTNAGLAQGSALSLRIYGLSLPLMNRMSLMPAYMPAANFDLTRTTLNSILVEAGDEERGMATIFDGVVTTAFADFSTAPEPAFQIVSYDVVTPSTKVIPPHSFPAGVSVAGIVSRIAADAGYSFVNYGVNVWTTAPCYLHGTLADQVKQLHKAYRFIFSYPKVSDVGSREMHQVRIWSQNLKDIGGGLIPRISRKTGLVGYPAYSNYGVSFTSLFDHRLQFMSTFELESDYLPAAWVNNQSGQVAPMPANGTWVPTMVTHELDSEIPQGRWFTRVEAIRTDYEGKISYPNG